MLLEIFLEAVFFQIRFQTEDLLCYFLVFSLDPLQLRLALIEVQALCFEFNTSDGLTLTHALATWHICHGLLARRNLHKLLQ